LSGAQTAIIVDDMIDTAGTLRAGEAVMAAGAREVCAVATHGIFSGDAYNDPDEVVEAIMPYVELGFEDLVLHAPGNDQRRFLDQFAADVLPALRDEAGRRAGG